VLPVQPSKDYIRIDVRVRFDDHEPQLLPESRVCENLLILPECYDAIEFANLMDKSLDLFN